MNFGQNWPELTGTRGTGQNGAKFNPRWIGGYYHSSLHTSIRCSGQNGMEWNGIHNIAHSKKLIGELERVVDIPKLFIQFNIFLYKNMKFKISKYFKISQMQRRQERYQYSKRERERERVTS